ncbi:MAG: T9SS type A sorting domain-containing protein [Ignavibacteriae bacterium]|nr:T9SS type A sorting domain-containing protein [Ignavibacteriota bacterium]
MTTTQYYLSKIFCSNRKVLLFIIIFLFSTFSTNIFGNEKLLFSHNRGFYTESFELTISSDNPNITIYYTLDGTNPFSSNEALVSNTPLTITIDPNMTIGRDHAPGFILKACAVLNNTLASKIYTKTYLFINKIQELSRDNIKPGPDWLSPENGHDINYGLDPEIYNNQAYSSQMEEGFTSIPTFSLVTELGNLFDPDSGIFVNALMHGNEWERKTSLELIKPDGTSGFQIDCGLRIRGGWSRHYDNPKHAFRFIFRSEYGDSKLEYPLFGEEGIDKFDNFDLRTAQNHSWSYSGSQNNTFLRDVFSRDTQREMNQPYTRSRYCHLYINGTYWGLFQTQERSEASFAESYFGGSKEDYDVIKVDTGEDFDLYEIEATDGSLNKWKELWNIGEIGFNDNELYFRVQGLNIDGSQNLEYEKLLDVNNLIDYMIITFFVGDWDGPISNYRGNNYPNNFYALYNRENPDGFKFFRHDGEHSLFYGENSLGSINVWGYDRTGPFSAGEEFRYSNPQWIHQKLSENKYYRLRFADRVYKHFFNNGALTLANNISRIIKRKAQIETAIIAESARWGDSKRDEPFTKEDWKSAVNFLIYTFLPSRTDVVLGQLVSKNLFNHSLPPQFNINSGVVEKGLRVEISTSTGTIYYTTDGSDPTDNQYGGVSPNAKQYSGSIIVNETTIIKTRSLSNDRWSVLNETKYIVDEDLSKLKITELHYHPADEIVEQDTISGKEFEFIELKNIGSTDINLSASYFSKGIEFVFPKGTTLLAGEIIVLASDSIEFNNRYSFFPNWEYGRQLDNGGEKVEFVNTANKIIFSFEYNDKSPWAEEADGDGYSLVSLKTNPNGNPNNASYWLKSATVGGSPGENDIVSFISPDNRTYTSFDLEQNYPNPFNSSTTIEFSLPYYSMVDLSIYNILGQKIISLVNEELETGYYSYNLDASKLSSGIYFYRIVSKDHFFTKKMLYTK